MTDLPALERAKLIPMTGDQADTDAAINVQFNPETLKVGLSNTLQAENQSGGQTSAAQYVSKSESTLSLTLIFDTSVDSPRTASERDAALDAAVDDFLTSDETSVSEFLDGLQRDSQQAAERLDVRSKTRQIADLFMQPQNPDAEKPAPPRRCRFQWGSFAFVGMVSSYDETLDFFSPEGLPLRAQLALTLKEDRYQFEQVAQPEPAVREQPQFAPGGGSMPDAARNAGQSPKDWRNMALFNGVESPRLSASLSLSAPGVSLSGSAALSGASISAGGISGGLSGGFSTGISGGITSGLSGGLSGGVSGSGLSGNFSGPSLSGSLTSGVQGGISAGVSGPSASFSASAAPAKASFSVGGSSAVGTDVPGAFISLGGAAATASAKASADGFQLQQSAKAGALVSGGTRASASGGVFGGAGASASGRLAAQAQASADFDFDTA